MFAILSTPQNSTDRYHGLVRAGKALDMERCLTKGTTPKSVLSMSYTAISYSEQSEATNTRG